MMDGILNMVISRFYRCFLVTHKCRYILVMAVLFLLTNCGGSASETASSSGSETLPAASPTAAPSDSLSVLPTASPQVTPLKNYLPVADISTDTQWVLGSTAYLDGSGSDGDGNMLSYQWQLITQPQSSIATLNGADSSQAQLTADVAGNYLVSLIVSDGELVSVAVTVELIFSEQVAANMSYAIVDTGQNRCFDSASGDAEACMGSGQDADYMGFQPSYTVSDDGVTVTDNVTGLIWQQSSDINGDGVLNIDDKLLQSDAVAHCDSLILGGRNDWRLPSLKEAYSLILFNGKDASSYLGSDTSTLTPFLASEFDWAFGDLASGVDRIIDAQYATTTLSVAAIMTGTDAMFGVNYIDGRIKGYPLVRKPYYVRCVTGNSDYGVNDFVDNGDTTISDNASGLMWQQYDNNAVDWDSAMGVCESATTAGFNDWRLPNIKELQSLVDYSVAPETHHTAAIDSRFYASAMVNENGDEDWGYYWSSTTHINNDDDGSNAAYIAFGRALGYMNDTILDVHGAGSQRSDDKLSVATEPGASVATNEQGTFYYKGPQGDILRGVNRVRCVRNGLVSARGALSSADAYTLFAPMKSTTTLLINTAGETVHSWESDYRPGLSVYLLANGELLRTGVMTTKPDTFTEQFGGSAGIIEILDWQGNITWSTTLASDSYLSHHDVEILPNGNILAVVWEAKSAAEAEALGRTSVSADTLWADAVYEICRAEPGKTCRDGDIVWRWGIWDHIVQDSNSAIASTYVSDVSEHPDKIDVNYVNGAGGSDWTHINAVDYQAQSDRILLSVHNFNEYWIIDHSDSTRGILTRVGNPAAYGASGAQQLFAQHDARWIEDGVPGAGNILVFNNGQGRTDGDYSSVDEFCDRDDCTLGELISRYSEGADGEFYADHISGAERLVNGNTLVCEGTEGHLFEYNPAGEVVWEFNYGEEIFRAQRLYGDDSALAELAF